MRLDWLVGLTLAIGGALFVKPKGWFVYNELLDLYLFDDAAGTWTPRVSQALKFGQRESAERHARLWNAKVVSL